MPRKKKRWTKKIPSESQRKAQKAVRQRDIKEYTKRTEGAHKFSVLGFDPALARIGWAYMTGEFTITQGHLDEMIFDYHDSGVLESVKTINSGEGQRLYEQSNRVIACIKEIKADMIAAEKIFNHGKAPGVGVAEQGLGIIKMVTFAATGKEVKLYPPQTIKKVVTNNARAKKIQVREAAWAICGIPPDTKKGLDDESDAIACAITCLQKEMEFHSQFLLDVYAWRQTQ